MEYLCCWEDRTKSWVRKSLFGDNYRIINEYKAWLKKPENYRLRCRIESESISRAFLKLKSRAVTAKATDVVLNTPSAFLDYAVPSTSRAMNTTMKKAASSVQSTSQAFAKNTPINGKPPCAPDYAVPSTSQGFSMNTTTNREPSTTPDYAVPSISPENEPSSSSEYAIQSTPQTIPLSRRIWKPQQPRFRPDVPSSSQITDFNQTTLTLSNCAKSLIPQTPLNQSTNQATQFYPELIMAEQEARLTRAIAALQPRSAFMRALPVSSVVAVDKPLATVPPRLQLPRLIALHNSPISMETYRTWKLSYISQLFRTTPALECKFVVSLEDQTLHFIPATIAGQLWPEHVIDFLLNFVSENVPDIPFI